MNISHEVNKGTGQPRIRAKVDYGLTKMQDATDETIKIR